MFHGMDPRLTLFKLPERTNSLLGLLPKDCLISTLQVLLQVVMVTMRIEKKTTLGYIIGV